MSLSKSQFAYLQIHVAVFLYGFTAILGALIDLPAIHLVWWRVLITSLSLLFFVSVRKNFKYLTKRQILDFVFIGGIIGLHWICFYAAIKLSNASISLICLSTMSLFTSILEPLLLKKPFQRLDFFLGIFIICGIFLIGSNVDVKFSNGIWVGLLSAALAALFSILNKKTIDITDANTMTFVELSGAWLTLSCLLVGLNVYGCNFSPFLPTTGFDWFLLFFLALVCTTFTFVLTLKSLKSLTAFESNLIFNLEPIYGIILAVVLLNEDKDLNLTFYIGTAIILSAVLIYPYFTKKLKS